MLYNLLPCLAKWRHAPGTMLHSLTTCIWIWHPALQFGNASESRAMLHNLELCSWIWRHAAQSDAMFLNLAQCPTFWRHAPNLVLWWTTSFHSKQNDVLLFPWRHATESDGMPIRQNGPPLHIWPSVWLHASYCSLMPCFSNRRQVFFFFYPVLTRSSVSTARHTLVKI
jgi:hypothetical protein